MMEILLGAPPKNYIVENTFIRELEDWEPRVPRGRHQMRDNQNIQGMGFTHDIS